MGGPVIEKYIILYSCHSLKLWQTYFFMYYTNPPLSITMNSAYQTRDLQKQRLYEEELT